MSVELSLNLKIDGNLMGYITLPKQIDFALASAVTKTFKDMQAATVQNLFGQFTIRGQWWRQSSIYGVKVVPMSAKDLTNKREATAELFTDAWWLADHEEGATRVPATVEHLTVPAMQSGKSPVRDAGSKQKLVAALRAPNIGSTRGWSVYKLDAGGGNELLLARVKKGGRFPKSKLAEGTTRRDSFLVYFNRLNLQFRKVPVLLQPAHKVWERNIGYTFNLQLGKAINSAK